MLTRTARPVCSPSHPLWLWVPIPEVLPRVRITPTIAWKPWHGRGFGVARLLMAPCPGKTAEYVRVTSSWVGLCPGNPDARSSEWGAFSPGAFPFLQMKLQVKSAVQVSFATTHSVAVRGSWEMPASESLWHSHAGWIWSWTQLTGHCEPERRDRDRYSKEAS